MPSTEVVVSAETEAWYRWEECGELSEDVVEEPLYECSECGPIFHRGQTENHNHRCPDCGKSGHKLADRTCAVCEEGVVEEVGVVTCPLCSEDVEVDEFEEHVLSGCI